MEPWDDFWAAPHAGGACAPVPWGQPNLPGTVTAKGTRRGPPSWKVVITSANPI